MLHRIMSPERQRRFGFVALTVASVFALAACSDSDDPASSEATVAPSDDTAATTAAPTTAVSTTAAPTTAAPTTAAPSSTVPATTTAPFSTDQSDRTGDSQGEQSGQLVDVRMARQDGFDRFVLEFAGTGIPMWRVNYVEGPINDTGDRVVDVDGEALLSVIAFPARRVDIEDPDFTPTYDGPERILSDTLNIIEAVFVEDFEANMQWVLGLSSAAGFEVSTLSDPPRIVVDVANQ